MAKRTNTNTNSYPRTYTLSIGSFCYGDELAFYGVTVYARFTAADGGTVMVGYTRDTPRGTVETHDVTGLAYGGTELRISELEHMVRKAERAAIPHKDVWEVLWNANPDGIAAMLKAW